MNTLNTSAASPSSSAEYTGWLMYHSVGVFPGQRQALEEALSGFANTWCAPDDHRWDIVLGARHATISTWAAMIGAEPSSVFTSSNVTNAFASFIDALGEHSLRGRSVLIAADCFPSLHFLLSGLSERYGFTLQTVRLREGDDYLRDEDFISAWDSNVALAVVTWVSSLTSKRADLPALIEHGRKVGSLVAVDITQGAGVVPFDLQTFPADFVCTTTLKWLCGVPGAGLAYINPTLLTQDVAPRTRGWFSQPNPFNWDIDAFSYAEDAHRFDTGTPSVLPFIASKPGLDFLVKQPSGALRQHNLSLCHRIFGVADEARYRVVSPRNDEERGGSVMLEVPSHLDVAHVVQTLAESGIVIDSRGRSIRCSPGVCTTPDAIERLSSVLPR